MNWKQMMSSGNFSEKKTYVFPGAFLWEPEYGYQFKHTSNFMPYHNIFFPHTNEGKECKLPVPNNVRIPVLLLLILPNYYTHDLCGHCSVLLRLRGQCELTGFSGVILCPHGVSHVSDSAYLPAHGRDFSLRIIQLFSSLLLAKCI